jgi:hypothetical protein
MYIHSIATSDQLGTPDYPNSISLPSLSIPRMMMNMNDLLLRLCNSSILPDFRGRSIHNLLTPLRRMMHDPRNIHWRGRCPWTNVDVDFLDSCLLCWGCFGFGGALGGCFGGLGCFGFRRRFGCFGGTFNNHSGKEFGWCFGWCSDFLHRRRLSCLFRCCFRRFRGGRLRFDLNLGCFDSFRRRRLGFRLDLDCVGFLRRLIRP